MLAKTATKCDHSSKSYVTTTAAQERKSTPTHLNNRHHILQYLTRTHVDTPDHATQRDLMFMSRHVYPRHVATPATTYAYQHALEHTGGRGAKRAPPHAAALLWTILGHMHIPSKHVLADADAHAHRHRHKHRHARHGPARASRCLTPPPCTRKPRRQPICAGRPPGAACRLRGRPSSSWGSDRRRSCRRRRAHWGCAPSSPTFWSS